MNMKKFIAKTLSDLRVEDIAALQRAGEEIRESRGYNHLNVHLSIGIQKMVRSDLATSGVAFSIDTESGFKDTALITSSYGLGELLVQGTVSPDEYLVSHLYDERNPAVKELIRQLIETAKRCKRKVGICGQAPSDFPDFAQFLVELGIDSISVTPDSVLKTLQAISSIETKLGSQVA